MAFVLPSPHLLVWGLGQSIQGRPEVSDKGGELKNPPITCSKMHESPTSSSFVWCSLSQAVPAQRQAAPPARTRAGGRGGGHCCAVSFSGEVPLCFSGFRPDHLLRKQAPCRIRASGRSCGSACGPRRPRHCAGGRSLLVLSVRRALLLDLFCDHRLQQKTKPFNLSFRNSRSHELHCRSIELHCALPSKAFRMSRTVRGRATCTVEASCPSPQLTPPVRDLT